MKRILVVDDDEDIRESLVTTLQDAGYEVDSADDGKYVRKKLNEQDFDLLLMDIIMKEKEGIETIMEVRREFPKLKIFAMSGGGRVKAIDCLRMASQLGAHKTFAKPFSSNDLLEAIAKECCG